MSRSRKDHPDLRNEAPGRIPESLIDAAMDGELDPEIQKEIGNALQYDPARRQELHDTRDAINALRLPVEMPDLSDRVLERANRHRRFIPRKLRAHVRAGRVGMAALLLVGLLGVASLQRMYPRLTTIASQQTPVHDLENAVEHNSAQIAHALGCEVNTIREKVAPVAGFFDRSHQYPDNNQLNYGLAVTTASYTSDSQPAPNYAYSANPGFAVIAVLNAREQHVQPTRSRRYGYLHSADAHQLVLTTWTVDAHNPAVTPDEDDVPDLP